MEYVRTHEVLSMLEHMKYSDTEESKWADAYNMALDEAAHRVEAMGNRELAYICRFARTASLSFESVRRLLRSLWTAYCLHNDVDVDTRPYDNDLSCIWKEVEHNERFPFKDAEELNGYKQFDLFMCEELV